MEQKLASSASFMLCTALRRSILPCSSRASLRAAEAAVATCGSWQNAAAAVGSFCLRAYQHTSLVSSLLPFANMSGSADSGDCLNKGPLEFYRRLGTK